MREILFRGKRVDNSEWVEGYYCRAFRWAGDKEPVPAIQENDSFMFRAIDPETVGQYTGLTDKNGNRIFEGDIIKFCTGLKKPYIVEFDTGRFVLTRSDAHAEIIDVCIVPCEVIGNIHDNPELLKGE